MISSPPPNNCSKCTSGSSSCQKHSLVALAVSRLLLEYVRTLSLSVVSRPHLQRSDGAGHREEKDGWEGCKLTGLHTSGRQPCVYMVLRQSPSSSPSSPLPLRQTRSLVRGVMERAHLLLNVNIAYDDEVSACAKEKGS